MITSKNKVIRMKCAKCGRFLLKVVGEMDGVFISCSKRSGCGVINFYSIKRGTIQYTYLEKPLVEPEYEITDDDYITLINNCDEEKL